MKKSRILIVGMLGLALMGCSSHQKVTETTAIETEDVHLHEESSEGRWQKASNGYWTFILNSTNEPAKSTVIDINGTLNYFDADGNIANEGWVLDGKTKKYFKDGEYIKGWIDNKYYLTDKGLVTGFMLLKGSMYYFTEDGTALNGWTEIKGLKYYGDKGLIAVGLKHIGNKIFGFDKNGVLSKGLITVNNKKYLLDDNGEAVTGLQDVEGNMMYAIRGEIQTGKIDVNGRILKFDSNGNMEKNMFVNGIYINDDGTSSETMRVTNVGPFADKDGLDEALNSYPRALIEDFFNSGWKLVYDPGATDSLTEISGSGAVNSSEKYLKFHNIDTIGHRFGHYIQIKGADISPIADIRKAEFEGLAWNDYFGHNDLEYFCEACGAYLNNKLSSEKAPQTYEFIKNLITSKYGEEKIHVESFDTYDTSDTTESASTTETCN